jgi:hypothetical protein
VGRLTLLFPNLTRIYVVENITTEISLKPISSLKTTSGEKKGKLKAEQKVKQKEKLAKISESKNGSKTEKKKQKEQLVENVSGK